LHTFLLLTTATLSRKFPARLVDSQSSDYTRFVLSDCSPAVTTIQLNVSKETQSKNEQEHQDEKQWKRSFTNTPERILRSQLDLLLQKCDLVSS